MVSAMGMTIRFSEDDVRAMGRATAGVRGMKLKNAERRRGRRATVARDGAVMLFVSSSGHGKRTKLDAFNRQGRGGQGVRGMKITASRGDVVAAFTVSARRMRYSCSRRVEISSAWRPRRSRPRVGTPPAYESPGWKPVRRSSAVAPVLEAETEAGEDT